MILTLWIVFTLTFVLMHAVPGGPYSDERNLPPEQEANLRASMKLDEPYLVQYWDHFSSIFFRLGFRMSQRLMDSTVNEVISQGFPVPLLILL